MKRILSVILVLSALICCVFSAGCGLKNEENCPALWVLESENGGKIYFFGSIHIADETMYPLPDHINAAYEESEYLAVEYDIVRSEQESANMTQQEQIAYLSKFLYTDGTKISDRIDPAIYEAVKNFLEENGSYHPNVDYYKPVLLSQLVTQIQIEKTGYAYEFGIDRHFINRAHESGKTVLDIESAEFQEQLTLDLPESVTVQSMYSQVLADPASVSTQYSYMLDIYKRGRDDIFSGMNGLEELVGSTEDVQLYNKMMLTDRNITMKDKAKQYLADGKTVFFVVGMAHMCGSDGIIELLRSEGYEVKRVEP